MNIVTRTKQGVTFCACDDPVWATVAHGFSTRLGGVSSAPLDQLNLGANRGDSPAHVEENFRRMKAAIGATGTHLVKNRQVHGNLVRSVTAADAMESYADPGTFEADGLVTDEPGLCLTVFSADCIPILFYDPVHHVIAAVHAGWRGTALGIAANAIESMVTRYHCQSEHIRTAIGPGIGTCCFETHTDVPDALMQHLGPDASAVIHPHSNGKFQVDLKQANAIWLRRAGVTPDHIAISPLCTTCHPGLFWSHRILGQNRGSMAAMIQL